MNRQTRLLIVIAIAVLIAGMASFGVYAFVRNPEQRPVEVVVAKHPLQSGVNVKAEDVQLIKWPKEFQVPGTKASIKDVVGRCLLIAVSENDPITESKLASANNCGLTATIASGMLAMSVKVNEVIGVAGFVVPGTRVDVIATLRQDRETVARVVLRNVQVLTAGTSYDENEAKKGGKPISTGVVTLMVTPEQAQKIALASSEGQITLALRNPGDTHDTLPDLTNTAKLLDRKVAEVAPAPGPAPKVTQQAPRMSVRVATPRDGSSISGTTDLSANVAAGTGAVTLQWRVDGVDYGAELTDSPYTTRWDTTKETNGTHNVTASVRDASGKTAASTVRIGVVQPCHVETYKQGKREVVPCS